jgi:hypothetical protein
MNYKGGIRPAYKQFIQDLRVDKDFIEYKKNCDRNNGNYGTLVARNYHYTLELISEDDVVYIQSELEESILITQILEYERVMEITTLAF